jgi:hypothetical protein
MDLPDLALRLGDGRPDLALPPGAVSSLERLVLHQISFFIFVARGFIPRFEQARIAKGLYRGYEILCEKTYLILRRL